MLDPAWLEGKKSVCITAGASTPEDLVAGRGREAERVRAAAGLSDGRDPTVEVPWGEQTDAEMMFHQV